MTQAATHAVDEHWSYYLFVLPALYALLVRDKQLPAPEGDLEAP